MGPMEWLRRAHLGEPAPRLDSTRQEASQRPNSWPVSTQPAIPLPGLAGQPLPPVTPLPGAFAPVGDGSQAIYDPHHYAEIISGNYANAAIVPSVLVVPRNSSKRNLLVLRNPSASANVYIDFGQPASATSTIQIPAGVTLMFDVVVPQPDIWVYGDAGPWAVSYSYSTISV